MFIPNSNADYRLPLETAHATILGSDAAAGVERHLGYRDQHAETPLVSLPALAAETGVAAIHLKDEGQRLGLGSFKALGGAYAVIRLVLEEAEAKLGRPVDMAELNSPETARSPVA